MNTDTPVVESIRKRLRKAAAKTPDKFCACGCYRKFERAKAAWRKHFESIENDKFRLAEIVKDQVNRVMELEEELANVTTANTKRKPITRSLQKT